MRMNSTDAMVDYARSKGYIVRSRIVLVEGTTDYDLFQFAARVERKITGRDLLSDLAFIPSGHGEAGGTNGVVRELLCFRAFASTILLPNGRQKYRICAVLDNDKFGRQALKYVQQYDISIVECRDVFLLWPAMPKTNSRDPKAMKLMLENANAPYRGLDWEPEDLLAGSFIETFEREYITAVARKSVIGDKTHRDFTADGKARLHHFVKENALHADVTRVIEMLKSLRSYLGLT